MRKKYVWTRENVTRMLHTRKIELEYRKDAWYQKYLEAETQEDEGEALRHVDGINGYLSALRLVISLLEAKGGDVE